MNRALKSLIAVTIATALHFAATQASAADTIATGTPPGHTLLILEQADPFMAALPLSWGTPLRGGDYGV